MTSRHENFEINVSLGKLFKIWPGEQYIWQDEDYCKNRFIAALNFMCKVSISTRFNRLFFFNSYSLANETISFFSLKNGQLLFTNQSKLIVDLFAHSLLQTVWGKGIVI